MLNNAHFCVSMYKNDVSGIVRRKVGCKENVEVRGSKEKTGLKKGDYSGLPVYDMCSATKCNSGPAGRTILVSPCSGW